jgi:glycosyltransferase involved in cell wall biosynthesis
VLTVANPSVPAYDGSLWQDIPGETIIRRGRSWEPSYAVKGLVSASERPATSGPGRLKGATRLLVRKVANMVLQPDAQILWLPGAVREGKRLLRELPHAAIVATGPPFSTFVIGARLARFSGLPLVLDYRDEWTLSARYWENKRLDPVTGYWQSRLQRRVLRAAKAVVATTRNSARNLEALRDEAGSSAHVTWIYNGYDPEDFVHGNGPSAHQSKGADSASAGRESAFRLVYSGTLWSLTSALPLVSAVQELARRSPQLSALLELVFVGRRTAKEEEILSGLDGLPCRCAVHPYLEHGRALELLHSADVLCAILADLPGAERVVPAKIFEYMASRRPILVIAPKGELWELLGGYPAAAAYSPSDVKGIGAYLERRLRERWDGSATRGTEWNQECYSRPYQARQLAALLESLT